MTDRFVRAEDADAQSLRRIVLFGRNVASYKFALSKSLLELGAQQKTSVSLEELAVPFSRHICDHLKGCDRQGTFRSSRFLDACRFFNAGRITADELITATTLGGFNNVIDAFHVVGDGEIEKRFFTDERRSKVRGISLTDELLRLCQDPAAISDLADESEARWRLVETAWESRADGQMLRILYDSPREILVPALIGERRPVSEVRPALNGYQKGHCFYCFGGIVLSPTAGVDNPDVDHFFPHSLMARGLPVDLDQVWNLVLACRTCNRGEMGKFAARPADRYLLRLSKRNEWLIQSHHPLRETLIEATGSTSMDRSAFLQQVLRSISGIDGGGPGWEAPEEKEAQF